MWKRVIATLMMVLIMRPLFALQKPKSDPVKKPVLTDEEKEIVKDRELLENLDLLMNFDKLRLLDLFKEDTDQRKRKAEKAEAKKDGKKKQ